MLNLAAHKVIAGL